MKYANEWLKDKNGVSGGIGEKAFMYAIDDAIAIANKINDPKQKQFILEECDKLSVMRNGLRKLSREGGVSILKVFHFKTLIAIYGF